MTGQPRRAARPGGSPDPAAPTAADVTGADWVEVVGESLHRDALATVVAPFPDRVRLTWAVLLRVPAHHGAIAVDGHAVAVVVGGLVVGWLPRSEAAGAAPFLHREGGACCPAVITRAERGDWLVALRVDREVLAGRRPPSGVLPVDGLYAT